MIPRAVPPPLHAVHYRHGLERLQGLQARGHQCTVCGFQSDVRIEPFWDLMLPLPTAAGRGGAGPPPHGLSSSTMALIATDFDSMRYLRTKWP